MHLLLSLQQPLRDGVIFLISRSNLPSVIPCFAQDATSDSPHAPVPRIWGLHIHVELRCPLSSGAPTAPQGIPLEGLSLRVQSHCGMMRFNTIRSESLRSSWDRPGASLRGQPVMSCLPVQT